ncbi:uncharacterized protein LOC121379640 [Gigantopelta aegis]|uniref:uncharacterized protein LOC121379640 n=1 Tax=Gigantopelta aegis TaxID=1735272 RepID=UPI001B88B782|nr:uncharacterized protein LOC121379640 [Gigantopelta aegis]
MVNQQESLLPSHAPCLQKQIFCPQRQVYHPPSQTSSLHGQVPKPLSYTFCHQKIVSCPQGQTPYPDGKDEIKVNESTYHQKKVLPLIGIDVDTSYDKDSFSHCVKVDTFKLSQYKSSSHLAVTCSELSDSDDSCSVGYSTTECTSYTVETSTTEGASHSIAHSTTKCASHSIVYSTTECSSYSVEYSASECASHTRKNLAIKGASHTRKNSAAEGASHTRKNSAAEGASHTRKNSAAEGASHTRKNSAAEGASHTIKNSAAEGASYARKNSAAEGASHTIKTLAAEGASHIRKNSAAEGASHTIKNLAAEGALHIRKNSAAEGASHIRKNSAAEGALHTRKNSAAEGALHIRKNLAKRCCSLGIKYSTTESASYNVGYSTAKCASHVKFSDEECASHGVGYSVTESASYSAEYSTSECASHGVEYSVTGSASYNVEYSASECASHGVEYSTTECASHSVEYFHSELNAVSAAPAIKPGSRCKKVCFPWNKTASKPRPLKKLFKMFCLPTTGYSNAVTCLHNKKPPNILVTESDKCQPRVASCSYSYVELGHVSVSNTLKKEDPEESTNSKSVCEEIYTTPSQRYQEPDNRGHTVLGISSHESIENNKCDGKKKIAYSLSIGEIVCTTSSTILHKQSTMEDNLTTSRVALQDKHLVTLSEQKLQRQKKTTPTNRARLESDYRKEEVEFAHTPSLLNTGTNTCKMSEAEKFNTDLFESDTEMTDQGVLDHLEIELEQTRSITITESMTRNMADDANGALYSKVDKLQKETLRREKLILELESKLRLLGSQVKTQTDCTQLEEFQMLPSTSTYEKNVIHATEERTKILQNKCKPTCKDRERLEMLQAENKSVKEFLVKTRCLLTAETNTRLISS